jgi:hypothetical protein
VLITRRDGGQHGPRGVSILSALELRARERELGWWYLPPAGPPLSFTARCEGPHSLSSSKPQLCSGGPHVQQADASAGGGEVGWRGGGKP